MLRKLGDLELTQLPALTYQLLLLADSESKPLVLRALNKHFHALLESSSQAATPSLREHIFQHTRRHTATSHPAHAPGFPAKSSGRFQVPQRRRGPGLSASCLACASGGRQPGDRAAATRPRAAQTHPRDRDLTHPVRCQAGPGSRCVRPAYHHADPHAYPPSENRTRIEPCFFGVPAAFYVPLFQAVAPHGSSTIAGAWDCLDQACSEW